MKSKTLQASCSRSWGRLMGSITDNTSDINDLHGG